MKKDKAKEIIVKKNSFFFFVFLKTCFADPANKNIIKEILILSFYLMTQKCKLETSGRVNQKKIFSHDLEKYMSFFSIFIQSKCVDLYPIKIERE